MPSVDMARMRADWATVAQAQGWSEAEAQEAGLAIKAAIDAEDGALVQCWADWLASESAKTTPAGASRAPEAIPQCRTCGNTKRPGQANFPGYCTARPDLAPIYGEGHPLRRLPEDKGTSCTVWRLA